MASSPLLALPTMGDDLKRVEATLQTSVRTADSYLTGIASHLISAGGKRLRPALTIAAAATVGEGADLAAEPATENVVLGGVSVELVHLGSLYHDDVIDEAPTRRSVESVNARWGNLRAILAGDFLLAKASEIAASLGTEVAGLLAHTIGLLCEGEVRELQAAYRPERSPHEYFAAIEGKTASLFATAARIGAIVAGHDRPAIEGLTAFGRHLGMAFQIVDDILDLTASEAELGKPAGHDLIEGVYTLPVLLTIAHGGAAADELAELLGQPLTAAEHDKALSLVRSNGGIAEASAVARGYVGDAVGALGGLHGPAKDALAAGARHLVGSLPA